MQKDHKVILNTITKFLMVLHGGWGGGARGWTVEFICNFNLLICIKQYVSIDSKLIARCILIKACDTVKFSDRLLSVVCLQTFHFFQHLRNHQGNINQTWQNAPACKGIQILSNKEPCPFPRGGNGITAKCTQMTFQNFSDRF